MERKKATIYEVAKRADVSTATVSRVLNDSPLVSDKTRDKVYEVIDELGFSPQLTAQKLAGGSPQTLAVMVPSFTTPYFNEVLKGIKDKVQNTDLDFILYNTGSDKKEERMERFIERGMADAVIVLSIRVNPAVHQHLEASNTPVVLINTTHPDYSYYESNDYLGGFLAGKHFAEQGFETVGVISASIESTVTTNLKHGFTDALKKYQIPVKDELFVKGETKKHNGFTEEAGYEAVQKYAENESFPEAVFCLDDTLALGAMYALSELGKRIPEDIAIMGYDNIKMSKYIDLTTVDQQMYSIGAGAIELLLELINRPERRPIQQKKVDPVLIERGSTTLKSD
jgi:LacI family transcriptional regulator